MRKLKRYAAQTHQGPHLQINEDDIEIDLHQNLFFALDGFGGSGVGDKTVKSIKQDIVNFYSKIGGDPDSTLPFYFSPRYLIEANALINALYLAHNKIIETNKEMEMDERGGASFIGAALSDSILSVITIGNCKAYLLRNKEIHPLSLPETQKWNSIDKNTIPLSAIGLFEDLHFHVQELRTMKGDCVLLLTDGVYQWVDDQEIFELMAHGSLTDSEKIDELFKKANSLGNLDNQSGIVLRF